MLDGLDVTENAGTTIQVAPEPPQLHRTFFALRHRVRIAFSAIRLRSAAVNALARALPPRRPSATAAGFFLAIRIAKYSSILFRFVICR